MTTLTKLLAVSIALASLQPDAAEVVTGGKSRNGSHFSFEYGFSIDEVAKGESRDTLILPSVSALSISVYRNAKEKKRLSQEDVSSVRSQCALFTHGANEVISCSNSEKNELAGVIFVRSGTDKSGEAIFSCVKGCSSRVPKILRTSAIESGC